MFKHNARIIIIALMLFNVCFNEECLHLTHQELLCPIEKFSRHFSL